MFFTEFAQSVVEEGSRAWELAVVASTTQLCGDSSRSRGREPSSSSWLLPPPKLTAALRRFSCKQHRRTAITQLWLFICTADQRDSQSACVSTDNKIAVSQLKLKALPSLLMLIWLKAQAFKWSLHVLVICYRFSIMLLYSCTTCNFKLGKCKNSHS